ncbi:LOW QUALITY PROTEIN: transporter [Paramyrothecium foliicola]|nr:LOW QUALITY PROTEIN: transporter [Paramyrothecium foliicola]
MAPNETSPLIRDRTASTARSDATEILFLNNVSPSRFWLIYSQVLTSLFIATFDGTIMASSHPVITSYFGAANSASWLSTAFLLTSTAVQPLLGRLSDALGRKPLFVGCLTIFALATVGCAAATSIHTFILARAFCGLGAGGTVALGGIIISDVVPLEFVYLWMLDRRRGSYQAYINIVYGLGSALGAALGGAMAEALGWRWEFGVQVPALLLCIGVSQLSIPDDLGIHGKVKLSVWGALAEFDMKGSLILTVSVTFFILGLTLGGNVLPLGFPTFLWVERFVPKPIMPLKLISSSPRANLIFSNVIAAFLTSAVYFNIPLYFQAVLLHSATTSGFSLVAPTVASSVVGAFTGFAIAWTGRLTWSVVSGSIFCLIGTICLACLQRDLPSAVYSIVLLPFAMGQGMQFPGTTMSILAASPQSEQAVVTSTLVLWRSIGNVLGIAVSSLVLQNALLTYLRIFVQGAERDAVIVRVRSSVEAVGQLDQPYRDQVVLSYEAALKLTMKCCVGFALVSVLIMLPARVPRLAQRKR